MAGDILELLGKADVLANNLAALDQTLRLFAPGIDLAPIPALQSRPKPDWALRGEVARMVFTILRDASEPLSTLAITAEAMVRRDIAGEVTKVQVKRVRKCLDRQRTRGTLIAESVGGVLCWRVA